MSHLAHIKDRCAGAVDVVVIGAGHSGLAAGHLLAEHDIGHVVLERGEVANAWRERSWDSLTLLTPNWQTRLPGFHYNGDDPHGYMGTAELVSFIEAYARSSTSPLLTNTAVTSVSKSDALYRVETERGVWTAKAVVIASGAANKPTVPAFARDLPGHITQLTPFDYVSAANIKPGGVLVVGASATGMQFADELSRAGYDVTIAVSEHVRMPRRYRGRDIMDWMDRCGILGQTYEEVEDLARGRRLPSSQLVGCGKRPILDLNSLREQGVNIAGRLMGANRMQAQFSGSLRNVCALADLKMKRLLRAIDAVADTDAQASPAEQFLDTRIDDSPLLTLDLGAIGTIIWATGFRPDYSWLDVPVLDRKGALRHDGGVVDSPGLYVLGLPLMRTRKSSFIFGIEDDARYVTTHINNYLNKTERSNHNVVYQDHSSQPGYRRSA